MHFAKLLLLAFACSSSALPLLTLPWFGHFSVDGLIGYLGFVPSNLAEERTIYQILREDRQYSRLVKAIDFSESVILLDDPSKSITFFAFPDHHRQPDHGDHRYDEKNLVPFSEGTSKPSGVNHDLGDFVHRAEELEKEPESPDKEKRKEALKHIIRKIIEYHILPESYGTADLVQNSTYATYLTLDYGSVDSQPLRLSVHSTLIPPRIRINKFVDVTKRDIQAKNGVIHHINYPLLPPPSIFQEAFLAPKVFSFFTSAIQRVGLTGAIDRRRSLEDAGFLQARVATAFIPTSGAFERLPKKLRLYLFSPFGQKALRKLLEYHIVPNSIFYTDYFHNATSHDTEFSLSLWNELETQLMVPNHDSFDEGIGNFVLSTNNGRFLELVYEYNVTLPTLLQDHYLWAHVARYKSTLPVLGSPRYFTSFRVNGHHVGPFDIPARNGALHVLPTILDPRKGRHHHPDGGDDKTAWEDWEKWLPQWAMED